MERNNKEGRFNIRKINFNTLIRVLNKTQKKILLQKLLTDLFSCDAEQYALVAEAFEKKGFPDIAKVLDEFSDYTFKKQTVRILK